MGCHPKALNRIRGNLTRLVQAGASMAHIDEQLDQMTDAVSRATEWDADFWGFDPTRWMAAERVELVNRADGATWPREVI